MTNKTWYKYSERRPKWASKVRLGRPYVVLGEMGYYCVAESETAPQLIMYGVTRDTAREAIEAWNKMWDQPNA